MSDFNKDYIVRGGTAYLRKNEKAEPSRLEDLIAKVMEKPSPIDTIIHISEPKTDEEIIRNAIIERRKIYTNALRYNPKVLLSKIERFGDMILNDGVTMESLQKWTAGKLDSDSVAELYKELFEGQLSGVPVTDDDIDAVKAVSHSLIEYIMTRKRAMDPASCSPILPKTPFQAWRIKETVADFIAHSEPIQTAPGGPNNMTQVKQFMNNFSTCELVLWNADIWAAAVRGHEQFVGTEITDDLITSALPMFWQWDLPLRLTESMKITIGKRIWALEGNVDLLNDYRLEGFCVLPTIEDFVQMNFPEDCVEDVKEVEGGSFMVKISNDNKEAMKIIEEAKTHPEQWTKIRGINIGLVFMPLNGSTTPEVRFLKPVYEYEKIPEIDVYSMVMAGLKFLTLKYVAKDNVDVSKKELKSDRQVFKAVRKGKTTIPPIKIIQLRRAERRERPVKEGDENKTKRQYTCHFMVDPHWRRQWFRGEGKHRIIRILTYVKGDLSKPFKPPREKVYKAVR
jgi:hypothetical protein